MQLAIQGSVVISIVDMGTLLVAEVAAPTQLAAGNSYLDDRVGISQNRTNETNKE